MKPLPRLLLFLVLLGGGIFAGRAIPSAGGAEKSTGTVVEDGNTTSRPSRDSQRSIPRKLAALAARVKAEETAPGELRTALAKVDAATLKSIVLEQYAILAAMTEGGKARQPHQDLHTAAMEELWERQKFSALEWAATLEAPKERAMMQKSLLRRALEEDMEGALPWMEKYHAENGKAETYGEFKAISLKGAVVRGADAVIRASEAFPESGAYTAFRNVDFPEDFDFAKLHQALGTKMEMTEVFAQWTLRDRDAAWAAIEGGLRSLRGNPPDEIGDGLMKAVMVRHGEPAGIEWVAERLSGISSLDAMRRDQILGNIISNSGLSSEGIGIISARLSPPGRLSTARAALSSRATQSSTGQFLATLPRNELIQVLRETNNFTHYSDPTYIEQMNRIHGDLHKRFQLTPAELAEVDGSAGKQ